MTVARIIRSVPRHRPLATVRLFAALIIYSCGSQPLSAHSSLLLGSLRLADGKIMDAGHAAIAFATGAVLGAAGMLYAWHIAEKKRKQVAIAHGQHQHAHGQHKRTRRLGQSSLHVPVLGMGGASLGDLYRKISDATALGALQTAIDCGIGFYDTSPWYGVGLSEARIGLSLHRVPRSSFKMQTKVGRYLVPDRTCVGGSKLGWIGGYHFDIRYDYSGGAFERQLEDSLQRLGLGYVDSLVIHDLEPGNFGGDLKCAHSHLETLRSSGFPALQRMRAAKRIASFGAGVNIDENGEDPAQKREWNRMYVRQVLHMHEADRGGDGCERGVDFLLIANLLSLLTHEAISLGILTQCAAQGVTLIVGGPFSTGILATGADPPDGSVPFFNYQPASDAVRDRVRAITAVCEAHGVPLIAAALQYPLRFAGVSCVIPGGKTAEEVESNVSMMNLRIPPELWLALEADGLLPEVPTPGPCIGGRGAC